MDHHTSTTTRAWLLALRTPAAFYPAILLGLQIVLAIALTWAARGTLDPGAAQGPLLAFDPKAVTSLRIEGAGESVTLARKGQDWLIPELADFPAEGAKVTALIDRLAGLKRVSPVATSAAAQQRHKVADDGFERKVTLKAGDQTLATLLLGDSPGFKRQFARPAGDPAVYDLDLPLFEVGNRRDDWLRRDLLQVDQDQITGVATADWTLTKEKDAWSLAGTTDKPDPAAVINLLGRIGALGYRGVLGTEDKPEYNQAAPTLELTVQLADGGNRVYRISPAKDSKDSILKAADRPWYFKLSASDLEGIAGLDRDRLLGLTPPAVPPAAGDQDQETDDAAAGEDAAAADAQTPQDPEAQREAEQAAAAVDLDDASAPEETNEGAAPQDAGADQTMAPGAPGGQ
ncbi:DUF4340 domain-containing protein [Candidatus Thiodictyon syntrophicum]|jgi:hypothetical protein|uniref:DUF4340 domain-containing protein n=1 Tax=Candidatus Thiodictyon syntrophicum TaxID=1166950 RepID=A0A2K8U3S7_9GAMM|nr:DUF4340 domain-containing protein [Candidatus Thiodictyon syntrophicum]AUB80230.1 hypothetical protein THSYN_04140 [Candidatus Thiodictyon syntrophicum]